MTDLKWLREIPDRTRPNFPEPVLLSPTPDGPVWSVATDGKVLVGVAVGGPFEPASDRVAGLMLTVWRAEGETLLHTTVEALTAWCGPYQASRSVECLGCECGRCEGGHYETAPGDRPGVVAGYLVDRNLLAKALRHLSGACSVSVSEYKSKDGYSAKVLDVRGDGWRVLLMGMTGVTGEEPVFGVVDAAEAGREWREGKEAERGDRSTA